MELNKIYNEDCLVTMERMKNEGVKVDMVLTSPPYNTSRVNNGSTVSHDTRRYDVYDDTMTNEEYLDFTLKLFQGYDSVLKENGVILYNISYGNENPDLIWHVIHKIITETDFMIADMITWKKKSATPNSVSPNKLTRITEPVFVICRKNEYDSFMCNKRITSRRKNGQVHYENVFNLVEAKNNVGSQDLNKATFSSDLVVKLLEIYAPDGVIVYDSFMGTGTTAAGCKQLGLTYIGSELSPAQCEYAEERLANYY